MPARKPRVVKIVVEGYDNFPLDMLRYDGCFPSGSGSVSQMVYSNEFHLRADANEKKRPFRVELICSSGRFTQARWKSFGWKIVEVWFDGTRVPETKWPDWTKGR